MFVLFVYCKLIVGVWLWVLVLVCAVLFVSFRDVGDDWFRVCGLLCWWFVVCDL